MGCIPICAPGSSMAPLAFKKFNAAMSVFEDNSTKIHRAYQSLVSLPFCLDSLFLTILGRRTLFIDWRTALMPFLPHIKPTRFYRTLLRTYHCPNCARSLATGKMAVISAERQQQQTWSSLCPSHRPQITRRRPVHRIRNRSQHRVQI